MSNKLALDALRRRRQRIAFDANVARLYPPSYPHAQTCLTEYQRLTAEIARLEGKPAPELEPVKQESDLQPCLFGSQMSAKNHSAR